MPTCSTDTESPVSTDQPGACPEPLRWWICALMLIVLGAMLYLPGIQWGLPAVGSWSQDTIAGMRTLVALESDPQHFRGRYPPLHYRINAALYRPWFAHWDASGQLVRHPQTGMRIPAEPLAPKVGVLILASRLLSMVMAIGAGIATFFAACRLTGDSAVGLCAAAVLMVGADFTYFARLGNVDVPSVFWIALSFYFFVRASEAGRVVDCGLLGLFAALAICTKDSAAGVYPGMAIVLIVRSVINWHDESDQVQKWALLKKRFIGWTVGLVVFAVLYLWINGIFTDYATYAVRLGYWFDDSADTQHAEQYRYTSPLALLMATLWYAASATGWPMLALMLASAVYVVARHRMLALITLLPAFSYYMFVIQQMNFVYGRFLFPIFVLIAPLVGRAIVDLAKNARLPLAARVAVPLIVFPLSLGYVTVVNLEMMTDSRYRAEAWFEENVSTDTSVGVFAKPQYLPRIAEMGYAGYGVEMTREAFDRPQPDVLVLSSYNYIDFDEEQQAVLSDLLAGKLGYEQVITFEGRYLGTGRHWLGLAGWSTDAIGKISPTLTVLQRVPANRQ